MHLNFEQNAYFYLNVRYKYYSSWSDLIGRARSEDMKKKKVQDLETQIARFPLSGLLVSWAETPDGQDCLRHIEEQAGLTDVQSSGQDVKLVGDPKTIQRAKMLLEVHAKQQGQIQSSQEVRERRLQALEARRQRLDGSGYPHSTEIRIDESF